MRLLVYCLIGLLFISHDGYCVPSRLFDLVGELVDATKGALGSIPSLIPTPEEFFSLSKNTFIGLPNQVVFAFFNQFCNMALNSNSVFVKKKFTPKLDEMSFILHSKSSSISIPLMKPDEMWKHPEFNTSNPLVIFVTGWKTNLKEEASQAQNVMAAAYMCRGNVNFVTLDTAAFIDTLYTWSAFNTQTIGEYLSKAVQKLVESSFPLEFIHLMGHSLGAQICGAAGRHFNQNTQLLIARITGLDSANPCFNNGGVLEGLFRGDAAFVDVIHTNPGVLGKKEAIGDIDFFCNGVSPLQPGSFDVSSSHGRAWKYYAESVYPGNENNFLARECTSITALNNNNCLGPLIPMGYATPNTTKGNYFLNTNSKSPYGEHSRRDHQPVCV
ncbi:vitellogenin-1-like [Sitodiplosis mosellana]|uniref:vitellogenin-1-like n=1 Tax=Sitodiplosis mosellana TaxID=263140 RepID=UPI00244507B2|nr:vitellogenin-1-like [Sitodiplosis mosellana]